MRAWRSMTVSVTAPPGSRAPDRPRVAAARCARSDPRARAARTSNREGGTGSTSAGRVPQPIGSSSSAEHPEEGHRQAGDPLHRPLRSPRSEPTEAQDRIQLPAPAVLVVHDRRPRRGTPATRRTVGCSSAPAVGPAVRGCRGDAACPTPSPGGRATTRARCRGTGCARVRRRPPSSGATAARRG